MTTRNVTTLLAGLALMPVFAIFAQAWAAETTVGPVTDQRPAAGKQLAMARDKGNCLACHAIADGELPGNIGPPLVYMQQRFPDKAQLRAQIWDATVRNPNTMMPPFGRHRILNDEEIDLIVDYIHSL